MIVALLAWSTLSRVHCFCLLVSILFLHVLHLLRFLFSYVTQYPLLVYQHYLQRTRHKSIYFLLPALCWLWRDDLYMTVQIFVCLSFWWLVIYIIVILFLSVFLPVVFFIYHNRCQNNGWSPNIYNSFHTIYTQGNAKITNLESMQHVQISPILPLTCYISMKFYSKLK